MTENGGIPRETFLCTRCGSAYDAADNFCRHCGLSLQDRLLPSVREQNSPALWQPTLPAVVVRGATFVAAGTIAELVVKRIVRGLLRRRKPAGERLPARRSGGELVPEEERPPDGAHVVSELFLWRRVRLRR